MNSNETHLIAVDTPDGRYEVECPTFQGPDAACRRVLFTFMARGYEPEDMTVTHLGVLA